VIFFSPTLNTIGKSSESIEIKLLREQPSHQTLEFTSFSAGVGVKVSDENGAD
jgi:hypothetical protein